MATLPDVRMGVQRREKEKGGEEERRRERTVFDWAMEPKIIDRSSRIEKDDSRNK